MENEEITATVTLLDILPGDPPRVLLGKRLSRNGKPGRLFQQMVPVPDAALFARLTAQASAGHPITVTITTKWRAEGYESYLTGFALSSDPVIPEPEEARA
jgi:hypothetical protein